MTFDFETTMGNDRTIRVEGKVSPYIPARGLGGPPEFAYPAEGGEVKELQIFLVHVSKDGRKVERELRDPQGKLADQLYERIDAWCADRERDYEADKAEYLMDQRSDR